MSSQGVVSSYRKIIIITIISIVGLSLSQYLLISNFRKIQKEKALIIENKTKLQQKEFENNVILTLTKVRDKLVSQNKAASGIYLEPVKKINPKYYVVSFYDELNKDLLQILLDQYFEENNIKEEFKLGTYNCFTDSIIFDEYVSLSIEDKDGYAPKKWDHDGFYFGVYFPNLKTNSIPTTTPFPYFLILTSLLIIVVILFFGYTVNTILKQKRISSVTTDFINNMTHELKTPISTISLSVDVIAKSEDLSKNERLNRYIQIIKTENKRLENQVERVLQIAKLEKDSIKLNFEPLDVNEIIAGCADTFIVPIKERNGELTLNLNADNSNINGDIIHITNIIYNLLDNANKYSENSPYITINTFNENEKLVIEICDKGKGISKEDLKNVFQKFYRVSTGDIHNVKGFGLGLYYVQQMVEKHNGEIFAKSKLGEGTNFAIHFPTYKK